VKSGELIGASNSRREDLLVYFRLNLFNGRVKYSVLPPELQRDVKALFGNYSAAADSGRELLFSLGNTDVIDRACLEASRKGLGYLEEGHSLQIDSSQINRLPPALRCYVGCASKLYGDVQNAHMVKIHVRSGKLTLLTFEDFETSPLPRLRERVKIDMRAQRIGFFTYGDDRPSQLLYLRSRYMSPDQDGYGRQKALDDALIGLKLFDFADYGPAGDFFNDTLRQAGYAVRDFNLVYLPNERCLQ
jgi:DNA phosphorothioation-associated putative methyltransferase